ncbi:MAG: nicotinate-nucleotide--dimethylbenzimidazole phosphoribosyltransferase [Parvibaculum sp.]|uniref:nicotinate-nucleotide--dimethylbenzimidazole phosphoribosyltransferase n=1 Tax=Parvibaculum sp. TaxID=2024848 RepID=UPI0025FF0807|nr:nicotinate-nucleotide--dimethylbenzimidazole phosphoribosyltransferase [Parvibaculum sp.]MCE9650458.1 nicotinate-nucleotide--dimethylbenzimidazole phosphoribosyltransferase [Parvibaculum sp.]
MTRPLTGMPFDDIRDLLDTLPPPDEDARDAVRARNAALAKPLGGLGRLEEIAEWLAAWQANPKPAIDRPLIAIFAATHEVAKRLPSGPQAADTRAEVELFAAGGAGVNQLALAQNAGLKVFDLALDIPTPDICTGDALSEKDCAATMAFGMESIAGGVDLLCVGAAGGGNSLVAAAVACALFGDKPSAWASDPAHVPVLELALEFHSNSLKDPLEIARRTGGRELAAMAGAIIAARFQRIPVLLDGFVACAAAAVLHKASPGALDHCLAAHRSGSAPHDKLLAELGKRPLLDLGIGLDDGTGAALAIGLVKAAAAAHSGMATRDQL